MYPYVYLGVEKSRLSINYYVYLSVEEMSVAGVDNNRSQT